MGPISQLSRSHFFRSLRVVDNPAALCGPLNYLLPTQELSGGFAVSLVHLCWFCFNFMRWAFFSFHVYAQVRLSLTPHSPTKKTEIFTKVLVTHDACKGPCFGWGFARVWATTYLAAGWEWCAH